MKKPNLFIVGAGRCGTTNMYEWLKEHPQVFMSEVKGPNFFGEEPNPAFPEFWNNEKKYLSLFSKAEDKHKILGEASHYFWSKTASEQIKKFNPDAKIIILLRNPVDVIFSYYKSATISKDKDIEQAMNEDTRGAIELRKNISYVENLKRFFKVFGRENVHIINFDAMLNDLENEYLDVCNFLNIRTDYMPTFERHNLQRELKNKWFLFLLEKCPTGLKLFVKSIMPKGRVKAVRGDIIKFTTKKAITITMPPEIRRRLTEKFKNEIKETERLVGLKIGD